MLCFLISNVFGRVASDLALLYPLLLGRIARGVALNFPTRLTCCATLVSTLARLRLLRGLWQRLFS